jgi:type IV pilus assembly protein PilM
MQIAALKRFVGMKTTLGRLAPVGFPVGVDFGVRGMKVLQVAASETPSLVAAAYIPTPEPLYSDTKKRLVHQIELLPRVLKEGGFRTKRVACVVPSPVVYYKNLQIAKIDGVGIGPLVEAAVCQQLGVDASQLVFRHVDVGAVCQGSKHEVIALAVGREIVERMMQGIRTARMEPVGMQVEYLATIRAFDSITRRAEDASLTSLYLDMGYSSTKVLIAHGWQIVFARCIGVGGMHLDAAVAKQTGCDFTDANARRLALMSLTRREVPVAAVEETPVQVEGQPEGNADIGEMDTTLERRQGVASPPGMLPVALNTAPAQGDPGVDLSEPLESLTDEVLMCLRYHESLFPGRRVDRTVFVGGEARHQALCRHVARVLGLPAQVADPLARIARTGAEPCMGVNLKEPQPGWATVLGACLSPTDL